MVSDSNHDDANEQPISDVEFDRLWETAAAEVRWDTFSSGRYGPHEEDGRDWPTFGSDAWEARLLLTTLQAIKKGLDERDPSDNEYWKDDPDKYVHLRLPHWHRRLARCLETLAAEYPWVSEVLDPKDERAARFVVTALRSIGIPACYVVRLADLNEARISW